MSELPLVGELFGLQAFRAELLGPAPFSFVLVFLDHVSHFRPRSPHRDQEKERL